MRNGIQIDLEREWERLHLNFPVIHYKLKLCIFFLLFWDKRNLNTVISFSLFSQFGLVNHLLPIRHFGWLKEDDDLEWLKSESQTATEISTIAGRPAGQKKIVPPVLTIAGLQCIPTQYISLLTLANSRCSVNDLGQMKISCRFPLFPSLFLFRFHSLHTLDSEMTVLEDEGEAKWEEGQRRRH